MGKRVEKALRGAGGPASANSRGEDSGMNSIVVFYIL